MSPAHDRVAGYACALMALAWVWVRCLLERADDNLADLGTED